MLSIVHAQQVPPRGGETGFVDMRAARATLSAPLLERAAKAAIHASVREIKDFRGGDEEDFAMFPKVAVHPLLANHYVDSGPLLYVGSPHMKVHGCVEINQCVGCTRKFFTKSFLGDAGTSPLDRVRTAASSPRNN